MNSNKLILIIFAGIAAYLMRNNINNKNILILCALIIVGCIITKDCLLSISISIIITYVLTMLNNSTDKVEGFKSSKHKNRSNRSNRSKKSKKSKKSKGLEQFGLQEDDLGENFDDKEAIFNAKESFLDNYKSLSKKQVKGLNKDTKDLIKTQKSLIETLNRMGPALKDGKGILDTFKNYFGGDGDLGINLKDFKLDK